MPTAGQDTRVPGLHIAPTEPIALRGVGVTSSLPERYGVDVMWSAKGAKWGVQRKEWKDLIASVEDGRWAREIPMMTGSLDHAWVVVEGWPRVGDNGALVDKRFGRAWEVGSVHKILWGAMTRGISVDRTADVTGTCAWVRWMVDWSRSDRHSSSIARPGPTGMWGHRDDRDWGIHILQGLDGVGPELAGRIWDRFSRVPWAWEVGMEELCEVEGVGKKKATKMLRALGVQDATTGG